MSFKRKIIYLVIAVLLLQVIKVVLDKLSFQGSYFIITILASIQVLLVLFFIFHTICIKMFPKRNKVIILSFFILIAAGEWLFGWWLYHPASIPAFLMRTFKSYFHIYELNNGNFHRGFSTYNPDLYYTLRPGVKGTFQTKEFNTLITANSFGLRDDESSLIKPSVICLGDSYGMGWGVQGQECFAQRLEKLSGLKVLNAGIASYGTARQIILLNQLDTSALTHIVIQHCLNDYFENKSYLDNNYRLPISSRESYDSILNSPNHATGYFPGKYFLVGARFFFTLQWNELISPFKKKKTGYSQEEHARVFMEVLKHAGINFNKVKVIVCSMNVSAEVGSAFIEEVKNLAAQNEPIFHNNLETIDVNTLFDKRDWFYMDAHINASGHNKAAQKLAEMIGRP